MVLARLPQAEKPVVWRGSSRRDVRGFSPAGRRAVGRQLRRLQEGRDPTDWKPLSTVGTGAIEIRVHAEGEYRVIVAARFAQAVYVLHAFVKKSRKMPMSDLILARKRFRERSMERARDE